MSNIHFQGLPWSNLKPIVYYSAENAIVPPNYSGGLGILAWDHLRAAADLKIPLVSISLLYGDGYFTQKIHQGQHEVYRKYNPKLLPLRLIDERIKIQLPDGRTLHAQVWEHEVSGTVRHLMLDSNVPENDEDLRKVTDRLYGGDDEHRLLQEMLLGIGGAMLLKQMGIDPYVHHINEGHAVFATLELMRQLKQDGFDTEEALEEVRAKTLFTTHTPVPAGITRYSTELIRYYFTDYAEQCGLSIDELLELGKFGDDGDCLNVAALALRMTGRSNGVSKLHGRVSRRMFKSVGRKIGHVTNGVDLPGWTNHRVAHEFAKPLGPEWHRADADKWKTLVTVLPVDVLWRIRNQLRSALVEYVRKAWDWDELLDPERLTVVFARRAATYKQLGVLIQDPKRLRKLLLESKIQFVIAGKAHPKDKAGKESICKICEFIDDPANADVRRYIVYLENYNAEMAKVLVAGADLWLNTPEWGLEASGTSGMKAVLNGALTLSVEDGWCADPRMIRHGRNGWLIGKRRKVKIGELADELYDLLEKTLVPLFFDRQDGVPIGWMNIVVESIATIIPKISNRRMLIDYVERFYAPIMLEAQQRDLMAA